MTESIPDLSTEDPCYGVICDICCWEGKCILEEIVCRVEPKSDFSTILILFYVVLGLLIGKTDL